MKAMVKTMVVVVTMVVGFIGGMLYTTNNTVATIGEDAKINIFVNDTNVSQRELTTEEISFVEANNKTNLVSIETVEQNLVPIENKEVVLTQNLVPASTSKQEVREQNLVPIKNKELTQKLVPASTDRKVISK